MKGIDPLELKNVCFSLSEEDCFLYSDEEQKKWKEQRMTRGFDDTELWSLDVTILKFVLPRLKLYREQTNCYPSFLNTLDEWKNMIDKMIEGIEKELKEDSFLRQENEGIDLFLCYFRYLWW